MPTVTAWDALREVAGFHLRCVGAALRELLHPAPFVDEDPQATADATAVRTAWVQANRPERG